LTVWSLQIRPLPVGRLSKIKTHAGPVSVEGNVSIEELLAGVKTQRLFRSERITDAFNDVFNLEQRLANHRYLPMQ
jgi:hypothetical protein